MWLTHWGRVTHICISKLTTIGSDNGLSPGRRQAIIWTNAGILLIWPLGTNFSETLIEIHTVSFKKMHLKMSSGKWHPFCLGLYVLNIYVAASFHFPMLHTVWRASLYAFDLHNTLVPIVILVSWHHRMHMQYIHTLESMYRWKLI